MEAWTPTPLGEAAQKLNNKLDAVSKRLEAGHLIVEARLTYGDPADEILKLSEELGADIIVMATHGRGGLQGLVIGSVATRVVRAAHIPVLLVRVKAGAVRKAQSEQRAEQKQALELATPL